MNLELASRLVCPICKTTLSLISSKLFCQNNHPIANKDGIINLITGNIKPNLTIAQKSGSWKLTSYLYERIWRLQSLSIMTFGKFSVRNELQLLEEFCSSVPPDSIICDLTCSTGLYGRFILEKFSESRLYFLDYSETMLLGVEERNKFPDRSCYVQNFAENSSFADNSLDSVVCGGSWNEITKIDETVSSVYASLKPGGKTFWMGILKSEKWLGSLTQKVASTSGGLHFDSAESVQQSFAIQGFRNISLGKYQSIFILTAEKQ